LRRAHEVELGAGDVVLGVILEPLMIQAGVVRNEVEHHAQTALPHARAQARERRVAAEVAMYGVAGDRESGAGDVVLAQVRQGLLEFPAPLRTAPRDCLARQSRLPNAQQPDPVETSLREAIELVVGNVIERRGPIERPRQRRKPDTRVDLIERGVTRRLHGA
jgi:hypothetical protein